MTSISLFERGVTDCQGACFPQASATTTDLVYSLIIADLRSQALAQIAQAKASSQLWESDFLEQLQQHISTMATPDLLTAFRPAIAFLHLNNQQAAPYSNALALIRFLVGHPCLTQLNAVIPAQAFGDQQQLYFPHLHALISSKGPLVVETRGDIVHCTWHDGFVANIPVSDQNQDRRAISTERVSLLAKVNGRTLLNGLNEVQAIDNELNLQLHQQASDNHIAMLSAGENLLTQVWPTAALASQRYLNSVLIQKAHDDHSTSITVDRLQGCLIASASDPIQIADAFSHEGSHARLALYLMLDPLLDNDPSALYPSPWRSDERPLSGILNGVHAFVNVCEFYRRLAELGGESSDYAEHIFVEQRRKVLIAADMLFSVAKPTQMGQLFLTDLQAVVTKL